MKQVPATRFRREIRKWIRSKDTFQVTRRGKIEFVFIPLETYNSMLELINKWQLKNNT